jgi:hypothetical protein
LVRTMDDTDKKILETINDVSPKAFVSPIKVNEILKLDAYQLGARLLVLKKSGLVDVLQRDYPSSLTLPNAIFKVNLTDSGREYLMTKK